MAKGKTNNQVDFDKLRKRRQRTQSAKRLIALGVIVGAVLGVIALNQLLIETGFTTRVSDLAGSFGGSGYPIPVPGGVIRDVAPMGNNLAVLNDTNLYIYNSKGKTLTSLQQMTEKTVMVPTTSRVLTYDVGGRRYAVNTVSKTLLEKETEHSLLAADMNENGDHALVTSSGQYVAEVSVYNRNGVFLFQWLSSENPVASAALNAKGTRLAVGCLSAGGGVIKTVVQVFDMYTSQETAAVAQMEYAGEMLLDICFLDSGDIGVLTDQRYRVLSENGTERSSYTITDGQLVGVERLGRRTLLLTQQREARTYQLILLDGDCAVQGQLTTDLRVRDVALAERRIYLLTDDGVHIYEQDFSEVSVFAVRGANQIDAVKSRVYYISGEEIGLVEG